MAAAMVVPSQPAAAAWSPPAFVNTVGGNGRAGMYPWGLAFNPVDQRLVVGDYLNYVLRRYDTAGNAINDFFRPNNTGQPYSVAIDPRNGDMMVGEIADGSIGGNVSRYDKNGNYLYTVKVSAQYYAWITIDASGYLWVADSHYWNGNTSSDVSTVRKYSVSPSGATQVSSFRIRKSSKTYFAQAPLTYGIGLDSAGNVYLPDNNNQVIHKFTGSGTWVADFGSEYLGRDLRSLAVDTANGWIYTSDAQQSQIEKFDTAGNHLATFGSPGSGDGQTQGGFRQLALDSASNVWAADYAGFRVEQFDSSGNWVKTIPNPDRKPGDGMMAQPRDVDVNVVTGDVWAVDSWNQRVQQFRSDGTFVGEWGHRGSNPPYGFNYPRGIAVDPVTQNVWVSNERGHYIRVFDPTMSTALFTVGAEGVDSASTGYLRWPNDVEFYNGRAYVADRASGKVKWFDSSNGTEIGSVSRNNWGLAVDGASGNFYVSDPGTDKIYKYSPSGSLLTSWGSSGSGDGQFRDAKDLTVLGSTLYVTDDTLSRVQAFDLNGTFLGKWGGRGSGPNQFANPTGISHDNAGKLYIADSSNDRVVVYDTTQARPVYENTKPDVTVTSPGNNMQFCCPPTFTGTATDNLAVANVEYSVQDLGTSQYWNASNSTWQVDQTWGLAPLAGPPTSKTYSFKFLGGTYGHTYTASVRARDVSSNASKTTETRLFMITPNPQSPDTTPPTVSSTVPALNQTFPIGPIAMSGTATDDRSVAAVQIGIKSATLNQWWNGTGWQAAFVWVNASVTNPGATSSPWSYNWTPPAVGTYSIMLRASDGTGNWSSGTPLANFTVNDQGQGDTVDPDATITQPTNNKVLPAGPQTFTGNATDNVGVVGVGVMIKNRDNNLYWKASTGTWVSTFVWNDSTLANPGAPATGWTFTMTLPAGNYAISVRAQDAVPNYDQTRPWNQFSVS